MAAVRPLLWCVVLALIETANADGVLGCGGFVKSDVDINFSLVEMKLYTVHGNIKYQTDCAPNNGYYLIPLYDKGDFILKVEPPKGWSFEPESVQLHVDGATDKCSQGEDINFSFKGFSVYGMVVSKGHSEGPAGVQVTLTGTDVLGVETYRSVTTIEKGSYIFTKIQPGDYSIKGHHSSWKFENAETHIKLLSDNGKAGANLVVSGYDVSGRVSSDAEPIKGVHFMLYSETVSQNDISCTKTMLKGYRNMHKMAPLCHVTSKDDGSFLFHSLPFGNYFLIPFYKGEHITFDVVPEKLQFNIQHGSVSLQKEFQVAGFSVSGRVLDSPKGSGVSNARILIAGKEQAVTGPDGMYHLENMKTGTYAIQIMLDKMFFEEIMLKITPNTPQLPDIVASHFSVCGKVVIDEIPKGLDQSALQRKIIFLNPEGTEVVVMDSDMNGLFCAKIRPGQYVVKVMVTGQELKAGLQLSPSKRHITVTNYPVLDVIFLQFRAKISGVITCIENCGTIGLSLDPIGLGEEKKVIMLKDSLKKASFEFENILPGKYKVTPLQDTWCWKDKSKEVEVMDKDLSNLEFVQTGYILKCGLSHEITLNFAHADKEGKVGSFALKKGINRFCLAQPGVYRLTPDSCHKFEKDVYTYDTSNPVVLSLTAVQHLIVGMVHTENLASDIHIEIRSSLAGEPTTEIGPLKSSQANTNRSQPAVGAKRQFVHHFSHWAKSGEHLEIFVKSNELLFSPSVMEVTVQGETCPGVVAQFTGRKGIFISGTVTPLLAGVKITVSTVENSTMEPVTLETDDKGSYRVGPLSGNYQYSVTASKPGFILSKIVSEPLNFKALKLGEIIVQVFDESDRPLSNVLLSLSGDRQYRSNNLTGDSGTMVFSSLSPAKYFLRPMMKEYRFEPPTQMVDVLEGSVVELKIKGFREAYSCYGRVTSLNGEPEPGIIVEAIGKDEEGMFRYQEESKTEQDGGYRIRGLEPKVTYEIRLKSGEGNRHIERAAPKSRKLKIENFDFHNVNIIAFRRMNQMDVSGNIITSPKFVSSLKILLYRDDNPDSPVHTVKLGATCFFYLPSLPSDDQKYAIRLESSLSRTSYEYTIPEVLFEANSSYKHFTLTFEPKRRPVEQELSQGSFLLLPLILVVVATVYLINKVKHNYRVSQTMSLPYAVMNEVRTLFTQTAEAGLGRDVTPETVVRRKVKVRKT